MRKFVVMHSKKQQQQLGDYRISIEIGVFWWEPCAATDSRHRSNEDIAVLLPRCGGESIVERHPLSYPVSRLVLLTLRNRINGF